MQINSGNKVKIVLRQDVIERIKGRKDVRPMLQDALGLHRVSIWRLLLENKVNGMLTTMAAVLVISNCLNLTPDQILTQIEYETNDAGVGSAETNSTGLIKKGDC